MAVVAIVLTLAWLVLVTGLRTYALYRRTGGGYAARTGRFMPLIGRLR